MLQCVFFNLLCCALEQVSNILWSYGKLGRLPGAPAVLPALLGVIFYGMQVGSAASGCAAFGCGLASPAVQ